MEKNLIKLLKCDKQIITVLKSIIRELDQDFKVSNFFVKRQFFKLQKILKVHMRIHNNL